MLVKSFRPRVGAGAKVLILGSMPGTMSLARKQYYAHPRNRFWPIMGALFGAGPELPYPSRLAALERAGVGLWDVLKQCRRRGSSDSAIVGKTETPNDFAQLFARRQSVRLVILNGAKAAAAFRRLVEPGLSSEIRARLTIVQMPSTSPAHAGLKYKELFAKWRRGLQI